VKILVAWDDPSQAELLQLYLGLGDNTITVCEDADTLRKELEKSWDIAFLSMTMPTIDAGFDLFNYAREVRPEMPVLLGCRLDEMISLPRFLMKGLRSYVVRDDRGDFIFLVLAALESSVEAIKTEMASKLSERLRDEMDSVRRLQETIIPRDIPVQHGYKSVARYEPSEVSVTGGRPVVMAGGDYYDVFPVGQTNLILIVGDASGHGLKACMAIMTMHTLIRMVTADRYKDAALFVTEINRWLCGNSIVQSGGGFITLFYGSIDTVNHTMSWASAGHPLALIHNLTTNEVYPVGTNDDGGLPLGIVGEMDYLAVETAIPENSRVLVFSDGLTDALSPGEGKQEKMFGIEGIIATLLECRNETIDATMERLFLASGNFTGGEGRHDDTSVLLVERGP